MPPLFGVWFLAPPSVGATTKSGIAKKCRIILDEKELLFLFMRRISGGFHRDADQSLSPGQTKLKTASALQDLRRPDFTTQTSGRATRIKDRKM